MPSSDAEGGSVGVNTNKEEGKPLSGKRLRSLDALRGFDMLWIVGGARCIHALAGHTEWEWADWFSGQLRHPGWSGFSLFDLIFPLFLFLAGVSMPYALGRQMELGVSRGRLIRKVVVRAVLLVLLGAIYNGLLAFKPLEETRLCSVLGYIGVAYFFAAMIYLFTDTKHRVVWAVGILLGYWAALMWVPVPGHGAGVLTPEGAMTAYIDRALLPWRFNIHGQLYDSQGLFVTVPAVVTALLGGLTGQFIREARMSRYAIAAVLVVAGIGCYGLGKLWATQLFISKELWNPPFVLHCAGWSLVLLGLFYFVIDALGFWRWSFFFIVIGMNSITVYLGVKVFNFSHTANFLFGGLLNKIEDAGLRSVWAWVAYIAVWWIVLLYMYRKKLFLRV